MSLNTGKITRPGRNGQIAMPPENEISPIERLTNPSYQSAPLEQQDSLEQAVFNNVPDSVPESVEQEYEVDQDNQETQKEKVEQEEIKVTHSNKSAGENFKELRLARERAEREREKIEKERDALLAHLISMQGNKKEVQKQEDPDFDASSVADDAFIEGKDYKRLARESKKQSDYTQKKLLEYEQRIENMASEARVRAKCPDLEQVVTDENVYLLRERYPDIAQSLNAAPDNWDKYSSVYTMIKALNIHKSKSYDYDKQVAIANSQKPKPAASLSPQQGDSPLTQVNAFIQDRKMSKEGQASLWKQMKEDMKKA